MGSVRAIPSSGDTQDDLTMDIRDWLVVRRSTRNTTHAPMINYAEISRKLMDNKKVTRAQATAYFSRRHTNPMIQWQWEAMTEVTPANDGKGTGFIRFPNGSTREFEGRRIT